MAIVMRKSFMKILFLTTVLLAIQVFVFEAFAEEARISTADNYQSMPTAYEDIPGYEIVKDEHGYRAVLKNPGPEGAGSSADDRRQTAGGSVIGRADLNNFVKLLIPEKATDVHEVRFIYKYYSNDEAYYSEDNKCVQYREMNEAQTVTTITAGEFNWSRASSYIITVDTVHGIYKTEVTQADLTSAITLNMDNTYLAPSLNVPFDLSTYSNYSLNFSLCDDQGKFITYYTIDWIDIIRGYKIPSGHYNIQAFAEGSVNAFSLLKFDYNLTPSTKAITFSSNDTAKVSLSLSEGNSTGIQVNVIKTLFMNEAFNSMYYVVPSYSNNISYIYVTKCNYKYVTISSIASNTNWRYEFTEDEVDASAGPVTVKYDLNLKTKFTKPTYEINGRGYLHSFDITNNNGQSVLIFDNSGPVIQPNVKVIKLTRGSESYTIYNSSNRIDLPNPSASGTFTIDYSVLGPLAVTPLKDSIYINRSSALANDAVFRYDVPFSLNEGQKDHIYIRARNAGTNEWSSTGGYKLAAVGGSDPFTSTLSYPIPDGVTIKENQEYGFEIPITAPTRGIYITDWQMVKGTTAFGSITSPEVLVRSIRNPYTDRPLSISSILPDKASPQPTGTKIRWTCNITGGKAPVYYFRIYKGGTVVAQSSDYSTNNYFDWTPTAAGTDYRALVYVKENGASYTTRVEKYSGNYTIAAPIAISSLTPDKASPQPTGTKIRWTCSITGGKAPVYYFRIYKGSTVVAQSSDYSTNNYFDWTPTAAGSDYRALVYVKENGASYTTRVEKYSGYYTVSAPAPIAITSILPDKASPQPTGTKIRWTCTVSGGKAPVYYFRIYKGSTVVSQSSDYSTNKYFDWTPTAAGTDYRALVYVKENGASYTTRAEKYSGYYTVSAPAPIAITSILPDKASPQPTGTKIRWTCTVSGGKAPVYYFRIYKGSTVVTESSDYSTNKYFDWTPTAAGSDYRALVYVKENGASYTTRVEKYSSYFTVTAPTPKVTETPEPDTTDPGLGAIHIVDIPLVK